MRLSQKWLGSALGSVGFRIAHLAFGLRLPWVPVGFRFVRTLTCLCQDKSSQQSTTLNLACELYLALGFLGFRLGSDTPGRRLAYARIGHHNILPPSTRHVNCIWPKASLGSAWVPTRQGVDLPMPGQAIAAIHHPQLSM